MRIDYFWEINALEIWVTYLVIEEKEFMKNLYI